MNTLELREIVDELRSLLVDIVDRTRFDKTVSMAEFEQHVRAYSLILELDKGLGQ